MGGVLARAGVRASLDVDDLVAPARMTDLGDDGWREGLERLVDSLEREAQLTALGRVAARSHLVRLLLTRLGSSPGCRS